MFKINGQSFDFAINGDAFRAQKFSLDITDNSKAVFKDGKPSGFVRGDVSATGTISTDTEEFAKLTAKALAAGSWQAIEPFDFVSYANTGDEEQKIEVFGVKIKLNKIADADKSGSDQNLIEVPFEVTSPDFVRINGVPYVA